uniref:Uncharacterized protein n=1 Tax=Cacopsylla melanoneura TaxID=428564 RepID=A0A8D8Q4L2_9HEMI
MTHHGTSIGNASVKSVKNGSLNTEVLTTGSDGGCTVDVARYVVQLEKRVTEQEQLISLLNEKIASLECGRPSYAAVVRTIKPADAGESVTQRGSPSNQAGPSFVGSKKTNISSVPTVRYSQFFVSRLNPSLCAKDLANDLLKDVPGLVSAKCSKMKTRHSGYSSFHVVVPEEQKQLVSIADVWPEGSFVKVFGGRLLESHVLESFDSTSQSSNVTSVRPTVASDKSKSSSTQSAKAPATSVSGAGRKTGVSGSSRLSSGSQVGTGSPGSQATPPSKNERFTRRTVKNR